MSDSNLEPEDLAQENGGDESTAGLADEESQNDNEVNEQSNHVIDSTEDPELEAIKARVREMEEEAEKLKQMQDEVEKQMSISPPGMQSSASAHSF